MIPLISQHIQSYDGKQKERFQAQRQHPQHHSIHVKTQDDRAKKGEMMFALRGKQKEKSDESVSEAIHGHLDVTSIEEQYME